MSDTGDMKFLNVCRRHLDIFKGEARWNPSNSRLALAALEAKLKSGLPIAEDVTEEFTQNSDK